MFVLTVHRSELTIIGRLIDQDWSAVQIMPMAEPPVPSTEPVCAEFERAGRGIRKAFAV